MKLSKQWGCELQKRTAQQQEWVAEMEGTWKVHMNGSYPHIIRKLSCCLGTYFEYWYHLKPEPQVKKDTRSENVSTTRTVETLALFKASNMLDFMDSLLLGGNAKQPTPPEPPCRDGFFSFSGQASCDLAKRTSWVFCSCRALRTSCVCFCLLVVVFFLVPFFSEGCYRISMYSQRNWIFCMWHIWLNILCCWLPRVLEPQSFHVC